MTDLSEATITSQWPVDWKEPIVSICCICYNHEDYLPDALNSILTQETNFPFEIIVHDDYSTDNSRIIIDHYAEKYPNIVRKLYQEHNIYSQGQRPIAHAINGSSATYIAFCECDDYWVDSKKLQLQFDLLESHPNINITFHPAFTLENDKHQDLGYGYHGDKQGIHRVENVISISGGYMPMASILCRNSAFDTLFRNHSEFAFTLLRHSAIQILGALSGGAYYIPRYMSVYRSMHQGSWSIQNANSIVARADNLFDFYLRNRYLNRMTKGMYTSTFNLVLRKRLQSFFISRKVPIKSKLSLLMRILETSKSSLSRSG